MHTFRLTLLAIACLIPAALQAQTGFALTPMRLEVTAQPGTQRNGVLTIGNDEKAEARFRVEILDVSIDPEATPQFEKDIPAESQYSCRQWLTVNPMEAVMAPSSQMAVRYTFRVPQDAPPCTYHCALGFTSLPDAKPSAQNGPVGIVALVRMTTTLYITVGAPKPTGELKSIVVERIPGANNGGYRAIFNVENSGLTNLRGAGSVTIVDEAGKTVQTADFPTTVIYPKRTQRIPLVLDKNLPVGTYSIRVRVNIGTNEIEEGSLDFKLPPAAP
jgi:hypothetical protein